MDSTSPIPFAMVSTGIRRDLIAPLRYFERLKLFHLYKTAPYLDLTPAETADPTLIAYRNPPGLYRQLLQLNPAVLQGVEVFSIRLLPYLLACYAAARRLGRPLIAVTLENRPLEIKFGRLPAAMLRAALRPVFNYARAIIYLNEGARKNLLTVGNYQAKLASLMYGTWGIETAEFSPQRDGHEPDYGPGPTLLFVGRLHAEKGVFDLLEASTRLKPGYPNLRLVMVGDGPARPDIQAWLAKNGLTENVLLTGVIKNHLLPPYFRAADIFVAPSVTTPKWEEQVGMTNIQAMACGIPVVSTRSGAIPEYVPDQQVGFLVPEHDPPALASAVRRLLADPVLCRQMGEAGRAYAVEHYDAQRNIQKAERFILGLL